MGTNYYLVEDAILRALANDPERLHIGKSSAGWCFALHVIPEEGIGDLDGWKERWSRPDTAIVDEYGDRVTPDRMLEIVTDRAWPREMTVWAQVPNGYRDEADFHRKNFSERGPNGLLRHRVDGKRCVGHGEGTWDLVAGEFS